MPENYYGPPLPDIRRSVASPPQLVPMGERHLPYSSKDFEKGANQDSEDQSKNASLAGKIGIAIERGIENGFASLIPDWIREGSKSTGRDILVYGAAALIILAAVWGMLK